MSLNLIDGVGVQEFYEGGGMLDESSCAVWKRNREWNGGVDAPTQA